MKKKYNKAVCLDTCLFNNIVGFDKEDSDFSKTYNKELLIKYIKHNGYNISDYNLYEVLRKDNWDNENIIANLLKLNSKTLEKVMSINPDIWNVIKRKPDIKSRNAFLKGMFGNISDFASDFYSQILLFSFLFVIYSILNYYKVNNILYDDKLVSDHINYVVSFLKTQLKREFLSVGKYTKSSSQKILNKYYLIINHTVIEWSNTKVCLLYKKIEEREAGKDNLLYEVLTDYLNILKFFDYKQEIRAVDGRKKANNKDNIIYLISNQGFNSRKNQFTKDKWDIEFSKFLKNIFKALYDSTGINFIIKTYYEINISDFYIKHIIQCKNDIDCIKLLDLIDPNDLIDLCALSDSYEKGFIFISNDSKINRIIDMIYTKKQKEFVNLFINFKFT